MKTIKLMKAVRIRSPVKVRKAMLSDIGGILALKRRITGISLPWGEEQLTSQITSFPEGQFVAVDYREGHIIGAIGTLVISRFGYSLFAKWCDLTANGTFRNHDREHGSTLFRSHLIVDPDFDNELFTRDLLSQAELEVAIALGMERIRVGIRLKDYYLFQHLSPGEYFRQVERGVIGDSWLNQTLSRGFKALALVCHYYPRDWRSDGNAVVAQLELPLPELKKKTLPTLRIIFLPNEVSQPPAPSAA